MSCPRARARINFAEDVIRIRVPRRCMDNPAVGPTVGRDGRRSPGRVLILAVDVAPGKKPREQQQFGAKVWHAGR